MKSKRGIWISGLIIALIVVSVYFDNQIVEGVSYIRTNALTDFFLGLTYISSAIIIFFVLTSLFLWSERKRKWILPLWFTLFLSTLISVILKFTIQRMRPFQQGIVDIPAFLIKNSYYVWDFSFPSNHAVMAFCAVPILSKEFPKLKYLWITLAVLVGFSRIYFGFHFLSDVIAGAAIGYLIGTLVIKTEKENKFWEEMYWKIYNKFVK